MVHVWLAGEEIARNLAEWRVDDGALIGQEVLAAGLQLRDVGIDRQAGVVVRRPGERRHDRKLIVVGKVDLRAAQIAGRDEAVGQRAVGIDAFGVEPAPHIAELVDADARLAPVLEGRPLRNHVDQAAWIRGPVKRRGRPAQDVDAIEQVGIDLPGREAVARLQLKPVKEVAADLGAEAADQEPVVAGVVAEGFGADARRIAGGLHHRAGALVADLLAADDADRLRRLFQWNVALGCAATVLCQIAVEFGLAVVGLAFDLDLVEDGQLLLRDGLRRHQAGCRQQPQNRAAIFLPSHRNPQFAGCRTRPPTASLGGIAR